MIYNMVKTAKVGILENLKITSFYKYALYLAGIVLILSLFVQVKTFDASLVSKASFVFIIASLVIWGIDEMRTFVFNLLNYHVSKENMEDSLASGIAISINIFYWILALVIYICAYYWVF